MKTVYENFVRTFSKKKYIYYIYILKICPNIVIQALQQPLLRLAPVLCY